MFEFTETVSIEASSSTVWEVMSDIEGWWLASNPEHESLERVGEGGALGVGTQLRIREKIAGVPGEAIGTITTFVPGSVVTWEAPEARYRWFGVPFGVGEGVTWRLEPHGDQTTNVSAHVWATFPSGWRGRLLETAFTRLLGGVEKDREHARTELRYLRRTIEAGAGSGTSPR